jgi:predicted N-formylglutamate amidohydrolase
MYEAPGKDDGPAAASLLSPGDPQPFSVINPHGRAKTLLVCDHAMSTVPAALHDLGVAEHDLARHIGWDIGAAAVTQWLAKLLDARAVLSGYSRLVIDCNRELGDPTSIPTVSDGLAVPGNQELGAGDKAARAEACYWPYHAAINEQLDRFAAEQVAPAVISIHSFTPVMNAVKRPWQIGVLWDKDPRIPVPLIAKLAALHGLEIGDNRPYSARAPEGFTLRHHAVPRGLPHVLIELRQDEVDTEKGVERYARYLEAALAPILDDPQLYRPAIYL